MKLSPPVCCWFALGLSAVGAAADTSSTFLRKEAAAPTESNCNQATDEASCFKLTDDSSKQPCEWCVAGAIPSECMSPAQAKLLPEAVFECHTPGYKADTSRRVVQMHYHRQLKSEDVADPESMVLSFESHTQEAGTFCDDSSKSISGYADLKGSDYDKNGENKHLFFWMFEKRGGDATKDTPFMIWLTGGPGCSSSLALLTENGPCSVNEDAKTTKLNPYSWTETGHVLWLDQPAGVGYSYGQETDSNEGMVSEDAYYFLQAFFKAHPEYSSNPFYVTGESYAGHYIPAIAHRVYQGNQKLKDGLIHINLQGLAIGNGLTNPLEQYKWYPEMVYNNSHHIQVVDKTGYEAMKAAVPRCTTLIEKCNEGDGMINTFACQTAFLVCSMALISPYQATGRNPYDIRIPCKVPPLCYDFSYVGEWLNSASTKKALHVDPKHAHAWNSCNFGINMKFHTDWMKDFSHFVGELMDAGQDASNEALSDEFRVLIYAGDVDFICNYLGNQAWALGLDWNGKKEFNAAAPHDWNSGKGLARTAQNFTFLQVYDAGHMVPSDQPEAALDMIKTLVTGGTF